VCMLPYFLAVQGDYVILKHLLAACWKPSRTLSELHSQ
jgi:hypothetical protein